MTTTAQLLLMLTCECLLLLNGVCRLVRLMLARREIAVSLMLAGLDRYS